MSEKKKKVIWRSPAGVGAFTYVHKPDTGGKFSDGKHKVTLVMPAEEDFTALDALVDEVATAEWGAVPDGLWRPNRPGEEKKKEEFKGKVLLTSKSKYVPTVVDARRQPLADGVEVRAGDLIKIAIELFAFTSTEKVKQQDGSVETETMYGVTSSLRSIQLLEKRAGGGASGSADDFEDEGDYETPVAREAADPEAKAPAAGAGDARDF